MGAQLGSLLPQPNLFGNPYAPQAAASQRYGRGAAQYHGAGSGQAARSDFNDRTLLERDALRRRQMQALAAAFGGQIEQGAYYGGQHAANGFNSPAGMPNPAMQAQGQMGAPPPQIPRTVFINGQAIPTPPPWQKTQQPPPEK